MSARTALISIALAALLAGCAHAPAREPIRIRPGQAVDLPPSELQGRPIIIELREGDVIPLDVLVDGGLVASPPGASVPLTVKRPFFLRIDERGLRISLDGKDFDTKPREPGAFAFGLGATKEGTRAQLRIKTPQR